MKDATYSGLLTRGTNKSAYAAGVEGQASSRDVNERLRHLEQRPPAEGPMSPICTAAAESRAATRDVTGEAASRSVLAKRERQIRSTTAVAEAKQQREGNIERRHLVACSRRKTKRVRSAPLLQKTKQHRQV